VLRRLTRRTNLVPRRFRGEFRRALEDPDAPLCLDTRGRSGTMLVAFGGLRGRVGVLPFEFFRATRGIPVKKLFVRDLRQAWYHRGIPEHGSTLMDVADALQALLARERIERLVVAGSSAGGYAALVFGTLLGADSVLCFAPQTTLDLGALAALGDHRWDEYLEPLAAAGALDSRWVDLRAALPSARRADTVYRVFFDDSLAADRGHAERLRGLDGLRLYRFHRGGHNVVTGLRDRGVLNTVLRRELDGAPKAAA
jgi:hypothetical protein